MNVSTQLGLDSVLLKDPALILHSQEISKTSLKEFGLYYMIVERLPFEMMFSKWPGRLEKLSFACVGIDWGISYIINSCAHNEDFALANVYVKARDERKSTERNDVLNLLHSFIYTDMHTLTIKSLENEAFTNRLPECENPDFPEWSGFYASKMLIASDLSTVTLQLREDEATPVRGPDVPLANWLNTLAHSQLKYGALSQLEQIYVDIDTESPEWASLSAMMIEYDPSYPPFRDDESESRMISVKQELSEFMEWTQAKFALSLRIDLQWPSLIAAHSERATATIERQHQRIRLQGLIM